MKSNGPRKSVSNGAIKKTKQGTKTADAVFIHALAHVDNMVNNNRQNFKGKQVIFLCSCVFEFEHEITWS